MPVVWKQDERDVAKWAGGERLPSAGVAQADVLIPGYSVEHKSRKQVNFPAWLLQAFDQSALNKRLYPKLKPLVVLSVHFGRGVPTRRFLCTEVDIKQDAFEQRVNELLQAKQLAEQELAELLPEEAA